MTFWIIPLVTAPLLAAFELRAERHEQRSQIYILKPLTTFCILLIAALAPAPISRTYQVAIVCGLVFSLAGDVFLMLRRDHFLAGLASFLVAHICYIVAFAGTSGTPDSFVVLVALAAYGLLLLRRLWRNLGKYRVPVAIYAFVLLAMVAGAHAQLRQFGDARAWVALMGAVLFMISDSVLALDRFETRNKSRQMVVLSTYFVAQWLIAISASHLGA